MSLACALHYQDRPVQTLDLQTDEQLMSLLSSGEEHALAAIIDRYQNDVFRFCLHYLKDIESAREMSQETFLRVFSARDRFDVERKFKPWMLCIARNLCFNEIKRKKTVWMESLEEYASAAREDGGELNLSAGDNPDEIMMGKERRKALLDILKTLPDDAREIVKLRYFERLSAKEIAEITESTEGAVRTRLHRILKQLKEKCGHLYLEI